MTRFVPKLIPSPMKNTKLSVPISLTASLAVVVSCGLSCAKKNQLNDKATASPEPTNTNSVVIAPVTNSVINEATNLSLANAATNEAVAAITNPAPATTTQIPAEPAPAPTHTEPAPQVKVMERPATVPTAPKEFYTTDFAKTHCCEVMTNDNYYFRLRGGYQSINHGDHSDNLWLSVKFFANGKEARERAGKNAWLIPDADAEFSHQGVAKPDATPNPGSGEGIALRASLYWPWMNWTTRLTARTNDTCRLSRPFTIGLGPTMNLGFDKVFDSSDFRFARYFGGRLTFNHDTYFDFTSGDTDGLGGRRYQIQTEIPIYTSRNRNVRYVVRGLWNTGEKKYPDIYEAGLMLEMPFDFLYKPSKWSEVIPCLGK